MTSASTGSRPGIVAAIVVGFLVTVGVLLVGRASATLPGARPSPQPATSSHSAGPPASGGHQPPSTSPASSIDAAADPSVWVDAGTLHEPRNATSAVALGNGKVLLVGSDFQTSWLASCGASTDGSDSVEIGDPLTGEWSATARLPSLRDQPSVVALRNGQALMTGGAAGERIGWSAFSSTYVFDPSTQAWIRSGLLNTARAATAAAVLRDGRVLVAGGIYMDRTQPDPPRALDTTEVWNPKSGNWSRAPRLASARSGAAAVTLADGRVLLVGGSARLEDAPQLVASAELYDPGTGRWSSAGSLAIPRSGFVFVPLVDGGAIVAGGFGEAGPAGFSYLSSAERYDPRENRWRPTRDLPYAVAGAAGARLADGRVLLAGGATRPQEEGPGGTYVSGLTAESVLFDPPTGSWSRATPMPSPRAGGSAVVLTDGSVVVVGGSISEGVPATPGCPDAHPKAVRYVPG